MNLDVYHPCVPDELSAEESQYIKGKAHEQGHGDLRQEAVFIDFIFTICRY